MTNASFQAWHCSYGPGNQEVDAATQRQAGDSEWNA